MGIVSGKRGRETNGFVTREITIGPIKTDWILMSIISWSDDLRFGNVRSGLAFLEDEKNIGHLSIDVIDGDREKLLIPLSNESELSITADNPSGTELVMVLNFY